MKSSYVLSLLTSLGRASTAAVVGDLHLAEHVFQRYALDFRGGGRHLHHRRLVELAQPLGLHRGHLPVVPLHQIPDVSVAVTVAAAATAAAASVSIHAVVVRVRVMTRVLMAMRRLRVMRMRVM